MANRSLFYVSGLWGEESSRKVQLNQRAPLSLTGWTCRSWSPWKSQSNQWEASPTVSNGSSVDNRVDVSKLEPLVAAPHSPDNRKTVRECANTSIDRVYIGCAPCSACAYPSLDRFCPSSLELPYRSTKAPSQLTFWGMAALEVGGYSSSG